MSWTKYDPNCAGCLPALMDASTGNLLPPESPEMQAIYAVWAKVGRRQRVSWHRVMCQNSRDPRDMAIVNPIVAEIEAVLKKVRYGEG